MTATVAQVRHIGRAEVQRWLPQLDEWLLGDSFYGVQHTWPQLYRRDGEGHFFVLCDGDRLLSHCACRVVAVHGASETFPVCLMGSVATDPEQRCRGLASQVIAAALATTGPLADHVLLWAERPQLYARHGFVAGREETCLQLARGPRSAVACVRLAEVRDHEALHALHEQKPWRVERSAPLMSRLLTTPGMTTAVLERDGAIVAYACCGKGADLQGHWHELGGSDQTLAELLPAAMHLADQIEAVLLLPPFRSSLRTLLSRYVIGEFTADGPMAHSPGRALPACWIDGLDSV
ncbi:MAG: GNAT family N-acetyltransferase [Planctomycetota bacterium]